MQIFSNLTIATGSYDKRFGDYAIGYLEDPKERSYIVLNYDESSDYYLSRHTKDNKVKYLSKGLEGFNDISKAIGKLGLRPLDKSEFKAMERKVDAYYEEQEYEDEDY